MKYSLAHLSDQAVLDGLDTINARDCRTTALMLAHIAEVEARKLYAPAGYSSMFAYCVQKLRMSEDMAFKRIRAARRARRFPAILDAIADGRLHLSGVVFLAPYLIQSNADELLAAAEYRTKRQIEQLLAERFPQPDVPTFVRALPDSRAATGPRTGPEGMSGLVPEPPGTRSGAPSEVPTAPQPVTLASGAGQELAEVVPEPLETHSASAAAAMQSAEAFAPPALTPSAWIRPLAPQRYSVGFTMGQAMYDKLQRAQELLSHQIPSGDVPEVLERALDALLVQLEKTRFARTDRPQATQRGVADGSRHIPAAVKRAVHERDGDQCTYRNASGQRCTERRFLEYDHIEPVARGGIATAASIRLRCRAHNQMEAELVFGMKFMKNKREMSQRKRTDSPANAGSIRRSRRA